MPIVTVQQGPQPVEKKRELVKTITDAFVSAYGLAPETVQVWVQEVPPESWGKGGVLTADR
jgi:4-oxalocrotonate tautomerase